MRYKKANYSNSSTNAVINDFSKNTNILDLLKRNKINEQNEKRIKIFTLAGFLGLIFISALVIF